jgi:hypothetical protein
MSYSLKRVSKTGQSSHNHHSNNNTSSALGKDAENQGKRYACEDCSTTVDSASVFLFRIEQSQYSIRTRARQDLCINRCLKTNKEPPTSNKTRVGTDCFLPKPRAFKAISIHAHSNNSKLPLQNVNS